MEFLDLFLPINLSSSSRARVFLWLMYHYLQGPDKPNPFDDDYSRANPPKVPRMRSLTREEQAQENVDPPDEVEWGKRMSATRSKFLKELVDEMEMEKRRKKNPPLPAPPPPSTSYSSEWLTSQICSSIIAGMLTALGSPRDGRIPAGPGAEARRVRGRVRQPWLVAFSRGAPAWSFCTRRVELPSPASTRGISR